MDNKNKNFDDFNFAKISGEDVNHISELEKSISLKTESDVVLIAYEQKKEAKK